MLVVGHVNGPVDLGCSSTLMGHFLVWFRDGQCERVVNAFEPARPRDDEWESTMWIHSVAVAADGTPQPTRAG